MAGLINHQTLASALLKLVREQQFDRTPDSMTGGQPVDAFPSIDLAVAILPHDGAPVWANVLFSREYPDGFSAEISDQAGPVQNVRYLKDQLNDQGECVAWLPHSDWSMLRWDTLAGHGPHNFVQPYPASLLKVMVMIGVAKLVDQEKFDWDMQRTFNGETKSIAAWVDSMIVASNNDATTVMVRLLHEGGLIESSGDSEVNHLEELFARYGLTTLKLGKTNRDGGWRSVHGPGVGGVGNIHMTAWDSARLFWLLTDTQGNVPWLPAGTPPILSRASLSRVWGWLGDQGLHTTFSSTSMAGVPGWQRGIAAHLPERWIQPDGSVVVEDNLFPPDVRVENSQCTLHFAHKTGNTENYTSDAGLVYSSGEHKRRYVIALQSSLGSRYQPHPACSTTWRIPALGAAIDQLIASTFD